MASLNWSNEIIEFSLTPNQVQAGLTHLSDDELIEFIIELLTNLSEGKQQEVRERFDG
jgi:hypothetical protein